MQKLRPRKENEMKEQELEPRCLGSEGSLMPPGLWPEDLPSAPALLHIPVGSHGKSSVPQLGLQDVCLERPPALADFSASCLLKLRLLASRMA